MIDLFLNEIDGNGGDMMIVGDDLVAVSGFENMAYLSMFGGSNWWGNDLLLSGAGDFQFNATTEATLLLTALNSQGRITIQNAIIQDLSFIKTYVPGTVINVDVRIISDNVLGIKINFDGQTFYYYWNPIEGALQQHAPRQRVYTTEDGSFVYGTEDGSKAYTW